MDTKPDPYMDAVIATLQTRWGSDAIGRLSEKHTRNGHHRWPTGVPALDAQLGGGIPGGHITELAGQPSCGMTTLALKLVAAAQLEGGTAVFIDIECALAPDYADRCGVDLDHLLLVQPPNSVEGLEIAADLIQNGGADLVVIGSPAGQQTMPDSAWQKLALRVAKSGAAVLSLLPIDVGQPPNRSYVALRLLVERQGWLREGGDITGYRVRVTVVKNRFGPAGPSVSITLAPRGGWG